MMHRSATAAFLVVAALAPVPLHGQRSAGDAALASGQLGRAESLYYLAARRRPRDPESRAALGRYLAARGALRVGAVLLEEARMFGGDARAIALDLAPLYRELGDWKALAALPESPLGRSEREQARWLVSHARTIEMPDSIVVEYRPPRDTGSLGEVAIQVAGRTLTARIEAGRRALVLDESVRGAKGVTIFGGADDESDATITAVKSLRIGGLTLEHVPARLEPLGDGTRAVIGLDLLRAFAPGFDPARGRLVLHRSGRVRADSSQRRLPTLIGETGMRVLRGRRFVSLAGDGLLEVVRARRFTIDSRRGELVVD